MYVYLETSTVEHFHMVFQKTFSVSCPSLYSHLHHTLPFPAPALRFSSLLGSKSKFKEAVLFLKVNGKEGRIYMRRVYIWISVYGLGGMTHGMWCILSCILRKKWVLHTCCMELDNIKKCNIFYLSYMRFPSTPFTNSSSVENSKPKKQTLIEATHFEIPNSSCKNPFPCDLWDNLCMPIYSVPETDIYWTNANIAYYLKLLQLLLQLYFFYSSEWLELHTYDNNSFPWQIWFY